MAVALSANALQDAGAGGAPPMYTPNIPGFDDFVKPSWSAIQ
jgi:hypothetical protein